MKQTMKADCGKLLMLAAMCITLTVFTACSNEDNPTPQEKKILVTKMESNAIYIDPEVADYLPVKTHDVTEIKYDAQGRLTEWWDNGKCVGHYTYPDGKILVTDVPDYGSYEHILSPTGQVVETRYADGTTDKLSYDEAGRCIAINDNGASFASSWQEYRYHWTETEMTRVECLVPEDPSEIRITYTNIPKKSNAPCLRALQLFSAGYWQNLETSGHLNISSDKYLPEKSVTEWTADGYTQVCEASYNFNADGTVKSMRVTFKDGYPDSPDSMDLRYEGEVTFTYIKL